MKNNKKLRKIEKIVVARLNRPIPAKNDKYYAPKMALDILISLDQAGYKIKKRKYKKK